MKKTISKAIFIQRIIVWSILSGCCLVALITFARLFIRDISAGKEIFLPGILVLVLAVVLFGVFSVTRVVKYVKRLKEN